MSIAYWKSGKQWKEEKGILQYLFCLSSFSSSVNFVRSHSVLWDLRFLWQWQCWCWSSGMLQHVNVFKSAWCYKSEYQHWHFRMSDLISAFIIIFYVVELMHQSPKLKFSSVFSTEIKFHVLQKLYIYFRQYSIAVKETTFLIADCRYCCNPMRLACYVS